MPDTKKLPLSNSAKIPSIVLIICLFICIVICVLSLKGQLDRERTGQASRECDMLTRTIEDSLKSGDELGITGYLHAFRQQGLAIKAVFMGTDLSVRNSSDADDIGRQGAYPCAAEALKAGPGAGPNVCAHTSGGTDVRVFAKAARNPFTGAPSGIAVILYPDEWFSRGLLSASLPCVVASFLLLALGLAIIRAAQRKAE